VDTKAVNALRCSGLREGYANYRTHEFDNIAEAIEARRIQDVVTSRASRRRDRSQRRLTRDMIMLDIPARRFAASSRRSCE
jgi:hypothetical protein